MNLNDLKRISKPMQDDLRAVFQKYGLDMQPFGARIDERHGSVSMKIETRVIDHKDESGAKTTLEREMWKSNGYVFGLKPEWLGQELMFGGRRFTISGLRPRGKKCVTLESAEGKTFVTTPDDILRHFALKGDADAKERLRIYSGV